MTDDFPAAAAGRALKDARTQLIGAVTARLVAEEEHGLRAAHIQVLDHLDIDGSRLTVLAERANMSHQAMGELVAELVDLGHLERVPDPTDGRARLIRPTAQGLRALDRAGTILRGIHEQWQNRIDPLRIEQILDALTTLVDVCDTHRRETRSLGPDRQVP
jgi:DNA-binding MarR family transcriptional regulator